MQAFASHQGTWTGTNSFRLMPTDPPHVASATAEVSVAAGGNLTQIAYTWSHPEAGAQDGLLVVGPDDEPGGVVSMWGDSWHQAPAPKTLAGGIDGRVITVSYSYAGDWQWIIMVDATDSGLLRLSMDNVVPPSAATSEHAAGGYWAMNAELRRSA